MRVYPFIKHLRAIGVKAPASYMLWMLTIPMPKIDQTLTHQDLLDFFSFAPIAKSARRIGMEWERFGIITATGAPLPYDGPISVSAFLQNMLGIGGWSPVADNGALIGLRHADGMITLEPGGQIEFSTMPAANLSVLHDMVARYATTADRVAATMGIHFVARGFHPTATLAEMPRVPKKRYDIMRRIMPGTGKLGLDMMHRTASVQVNLDASDTADQAELVTLVTILQPIVAAIFANSNMVEGEITPYASYRNQVWLDTDPARTGLLPGTAARNFSIDTYVDYLLAMPMYFYERDGKIIATPGGNFADFMHGRLAGHSGEYATIEDWALHVTTAFPTVRIKPWLEIRGSDSQDFPDAMAVPALWTGLLYDDNSRAQATALCADWTELEIVALHTTTPRLGLATPFRGSTIRPLAQELLHLAKNGLGAAEQIYLASAQI
jgi:glutamate--cysteine ligase